MMPGSLLFSLALAGGLVGIVVPAGCLDLQVAIFSTGSDVKARIVIGGSTLVGLTVIIDVDDGGQVLLGVGDLLID